LAKRPRVYDLFTTPKVRSILKSLTRGETTVDIRELILSQLRRKGRIRVSDVARLTGFSRVYVHRFFKQLADEGQILLTGKANQAH
jgi:predicted transcriptional regulator